MRHRLLPGNLVGEGIRVERNAIVGLRFLYGRVHRHHDASILAVRLRRAANAVVVAGIGHHVFVIVLGGIDHGIPSICQYGDVRFVDDADDVRAREPGPVDGIAQHRIDRHGPEVVRPFWQVTACTVAGAVIERLANAASVRRCFMFGRTKVGAPQRRSLFDHHAFRMRARRAN